MTFPRPQRRFFEPGRCPDCGMPVVGAGSQLRCLHCGLMLAGPTVQHLAATLLDADQTLTRLRHESLAPASSQPALSFTPPGGSSTHRAPAPATSGIPLYPAAAADRPQPQDSPERSVGGATILLTLGGLCLVVAAIVFITVSWGSFGLSAKVAVLGGVTLLLAIASAAVTRQGLRGSAETLWTITLLDLALDLSAARYANLAGVRTIPFATYSALAAALVAVAATLVCLVTRDGARTAPLAAPQVVAALAATAAGGSVCHQLQLLPWLSLALVPAALFALTLAARAARLSIGASVCAALAVIDCTGLVLLGLDNVIAGNFTAGLLDGHGWALPAAGLLLICAAAVPQVFVQADLRIASAAVGIGAVAGTGLAIAAGYLPFGAALALLVLAATATSYLRTRIWQPASAIVLAIVLAAAVTTVALTAMAGAAVDSASAHGMWQHGPAAQLVHRLPVSAIALLMLLVVVSGAVELRSSHYGVAVPLHWNLAGALPVGAGIAMALDPNVSAAAGVWFAAAALGVLLAHRYRRAELLAPVGVAALVGQVGALAAAWPTIGFAIGGALLNGLLWCANPARRLRTALEFLGITELFLGVAAGTQLVQPADWTPAVVGLLAVTVAFGSGAALSASRRWWSWLALASLTAAIWIESAARSLHAPEVYSVPAGLLLLAIGTVGVRGATKPTSWLTLAPGLAVLTAPTLLLALEAPLSWRAIAIGSAAVVMVIAGAQWRGQAPLLIGATELAMLVLRELSPYALAAPRWITIGAVGMLLLGMGITWERRVKNLQDAQRLLASLH
jgi:hypothetical protein